MLSNVSCGFSPSHVPENRSETDSATNADILFIGSGNFSLPLSFVENRIDNLTKTHQQGAAQSFPGRVLVTELKSEDECLRDPVTRQNIDILKALGASVMFQVDGQYLDTTFPGRHFTRIQWDCPDTNGIFCDSNYELPDTIKKTAAAAYSLLRTGDTLHFTLITPRINGNLWQAAHYQIPQVEDAGYYLNEGAPRRSGLRRYNYTFMKTQGDGKVDAAELGEMSEFVYVRHPTQRTPNRYLRTYAAHKQEPLRGGGSVPVDYGDYPYYSMPAGRACSPTIHLPSFFDAKMPSLKPAERAYSPTLDDLDEQGELDLEMNYEIDSLELEDLTPKQARIALRKASSDCIKNRRGT